MMKEHPSAIAPHMARWHEVTAKAPCTICRKPDWCSISADGIVRVCRRVGDVIGKHGVDSAGVDYWSYFSNDNRSLSEGTTPIIQAPRTAPIASPDTLDKVYSALLGVLPLEEKHRNNLSDRGISDVEIDRRGYRSLPPKGRQDVVERVLGAGYEDQLGKVPGFHREAGRGWLLMGTPGLLVPVRDRLGHIIAFKVRRDEEVANPRYLYVTSTRHGGPGPGSPIHVPLYEGSTQVVRLTEGELKADVATISTGVLTISIPGVSTWRASLPVLKKLGAERVILAFDADARTNQHVALALRNTAEALEREGFKVELETWDVAKAKGIDDALKVDETITLQTGEAARREIASISVQAGLPLKPDKIGLFRVDDRGVWREDPNADPGKRKVDLFVCSRLDVLALSRNEHNEDWGRIVRFRDKDDHVHQFSVPMEILAGDGTVLRELLLSKGLLIGMSTPAKVALLEYLQTASPPERVRCVSRAGWNGDTYVLPDSSWGGQDEDIILQRTDLHDQAMKPSGSLAEWQEGVAAKCSGNSRLVFALSCAFAPPLLKLVGEDCGGFHIRGGSSTGKTTALLASGSVWGGPGYLQRWRATGNALEAIAEGHCDALLLLDELAQVNPKEAGEISYMLANGSGKARANRLGKAKQRATWRLIFLSAGEIGLSDHMKTAGLQAKAGQEIRLADIDADAGKGMGMFEELHGVQSPDAFARNIADAAKRYYGTPIRAFLEQVVTHRQDLEAAIQHSRKDFMARYVPEGASGEVSRVAGRFALVAAAGEMAQFSGIVPWKEGEATIAAGVCFQAWLEGREGIGGSDIERAIAQVRAFIGAHGASRFVDLDSFDQEPIQDPKIINRAGFRRRKGDQTEYLFLSDVFRDEVCSSFDYKLVARELCERGLLIRGTEANKFTDKVRVPGLSRPSVYRIQAAVMEDA